MTKNRVQRFTFRIDEREKALIEALSKRLQRNRSDAVRFVIREAFNSLELEERGEKRNADQK